MKNRIFTLWLPAMVVGSLMISCSSTGPKNIVRDRSAYLNAISDSWKNQLLLNIVKLRYADAPVFLDISSIVNSYEIRGQVNAGAGLESKGSGFMPYLGSEASFTDKPTVSYSPLSGSKFAMSLMNPVSINTVMGLIYAGYPVDLVFRLLVSSINGIENRFSGLMRKTEGSPDFYRLISLLRQLQGNNLIAVNLSDQKELLISFSPQNSTDTVMSNELLEVSKILGISHMNQNYKVSYGSHPGDSCHILLKTRSLIEILTEISNTIEVPQEHVLASEAMPASEIIGPDGKTIKPLLMIRSSKEEPAQAFFSVSYNNYWFYIDRHDYYSKKVFTFLLFLSALSDSDDTKSSPVLTIPAN